MRKKQLKYALRVAVKNTLFARFSSKTEGKTGMLQANSPPKQPPRTPPWLSDINAKGRYIFRLTLQLPLMGKQRKQTCRFPPLLLRLTFTDSPLWLPDCKSMRRPSVWACAVSCGKSVQKTVFLSEALVLCAEYSVCAQLALWGLREPPAVVMRPSEGGVWFCVSWRGGAYCVTWPPMIEWRTKAAIIF